MKKEQNESKLLNCPFCGGDARMNQPFNHVTGERFKGYFVVSCDNCRSVGKWERTKQAASKSWNTRTPSQNEHSQTQQPAQASTDEMPYRHDSDALEKAGREIKAWKETAELRCRNEFFYRGIVEQIGKMFEPDCYISDDGSVQQDVLALKVPELVQKAVQSPHPKEPMPDVAEKIELIRALKEIGNSGHLSSYDSDKIIRGAKLLENLSTSIANNLLDAVTKAIIWQANYSYSKEYKEDCFKNEYSYWSDIAKAALSVMQPQNEADKIQALYDKTTQAILNGDLIKVTTISKEEMQKQPYEGQCIDKSGTALEDTTSLQSSTASHQPTSNQELEKDVVEQLMILLEPHRQDIMVDKRFMRNIAETCIKALQPVSNQGLIEEAEDFVRGCEYDKKPYQKTVEYYKNMSDDDIEIFEKLPAYMQEHIKRLAYYAIKYPEVINILTKCKSALSKNKVG